MDSLLSVLATAGMNVIAVLVQIIILGVAYFVLRLIKAKLGIQFAQIFVKSIEQTLKEFDGAEKKRIAADLLKKKLGFLFSADDIDHLIEAAVYEMNQVTTNPPISITTASNLNSQIPDEETTPFSKTPGAKY